MRYIKKFNESWNNNPKVLLKEEDEEKYALVNEFLTTDLTNLKLAIKKFKLKVADSKVIKNIESIITTQLIDPYANIENTVDRIHDYFKTINTPKSYDEYLSQTFDQALYLSNLEKLTEDENHS
jgi:hypothetical protein